MSGAVIITGLIVLGALVLLAAAYWRWGPKSIDVPAEVEQVKATIEPEAPQEQTTIESSSGNLVDPETEKIIGNPLLRWGRPERRRYVPDEYDEPIKCLACGREILPGQFFWETPLINRETGEDTGSSFQLCLACQPGDIAAVIHRGA